MTNPFLFQLTRYQNRYLRVGDDGQCFLDRRCHRRNREHGSDAEGDSGGGGLDVDAEGDPCESDEEDAGDVDGQYVGLHVPLEREGH